MKSIVNVPIYVTIFVLLTVFTANAESNIHLKLATQDFPPFSYLKDKKVTLSDQVVEGPAAEIIEQVCKHMEIDFTLKLLPWRRAQYDTREAKLYHGLFLIGWNKKRTEWLYYSPPVLETEYGFFVREDNPLNYEKFEDIKGYRVGVFGPSNTSNSLKKIKDKMADFKIDMRPDDLSGFKKLSVGRVEAVYSNRDVGFAIIKTLGLTDIRYAGQHRKLNYYIGFAKDNIDKKVVDKFGDTLINLYQQGAIEEILIKYNMKPATGF